MGTGLTMISHAKSCLHGVQSTTSTFTLPFNFSTTSLSALVTGGCGVTTPSSHITATFSFRLLLLLLLTFVVAATEYLQPIATRSGSLNHGFPLFSSRLTFMNTSSPFRLVDIGPFVGTMCSAPHSNGAHPVIGRRVAVGLNPKTVAFGVSQQFFQGGRVNNNLKRACYSGKPFLSPKSRHRDIHLGKQL